MKLKILLLLLASLVLTKSFVIKDDQLKSIRSDYERVDCYPEAPFSFGEDIREKCLQRNCMFESSSTPNVPWCFFPQNSFGYTMTESEETDTGLRIVLKRLQTHKSPFPDPIENLVLTVDFLNPKTLNIKIKDQDSDRYEVPIVLEDVRSPTMKSKDESELSFEFKNGIDEVFEFKIVRKSTGTVLFDTSIGSFVYNDQFLQIATKLPKDSNVYGFG